MDLKRAVSLPFFLAMLLAAIAITCLLTGVLLGRRLPRAGRAREPERFATHSDSRSVKMVSGLLQRAANARLPVMIVNCDDGSATPARLETTGAKETQLTLQRQDAAPLRWRHDALIILTFNLDDRVRTCMTSVLELVGDDETATLSLVTPTAIATGDERAAFRIAATGEGLEALVLHRDHPWEGHITHVSPDSIDVRFDGSRPRMAVGHQVELVVHLGGEDLETVLYVARSYARSFSLTLNPPARRGSDRRVATCELVTRLLEREDAAA